MEKVYLIIVLFVNTIVLFANPVPEVSVRIHALYFDKNNDWVLKLSSYNMFENDSLSSDSIIICSSSGCSRINKKYVVLGNIITLTKDSMTSNLKINPDGDSVIVKFYYRYVSNRNISDTYNYFSDPYIIFGKYKNSRIQKPKYGQSIVRIPVNDSYWTAYTINNSIESFLDTSKMQGTLHGRVFDKNGNLLSYGLFMFARSTYSFSGMGFVSEAINLQILPNSTYSIRLYSLKYNENTIYDKLHKSGVNYTLRNMKPLSFTMQPDTVIEKDIYLTDFVGIENKNSHKNFANFYPNPISLTSKLNYEISFPVISTKCFINILNTYGQMLFQYRITDNTGQIHLPNSLKEGAYLVQIELNGVICYSSRILVDKK